MSKTAVIIAILFAGIAVAAMLAFTPGMQTQQSGRSQSVSTLSTYATRVSNQLSMGPDPGGKTGDTVTPTTTKTGQPSADGTGAAHQSGANSGQPPPTGTTTTSPTSSSPSSRPGNDH
jgi:hypothetical protein